MTPVMHPSSSKLFSAYLVAQDVQVSLDVVPQSPPLAPASRSLDVRASPSLFHGASDALQQTPAKRARPSRTRKVKKAGRKSPSTAGSTGRRARGHDVLPVQGRPSRGASGTGMDHGSVMWGDMNDSDSDGGSEYNPYSPG